MRSSYHRELQSRTGGIESSSSHMNCGLWKRIWKANVPPKVKNLVWRAIRGGLPSMDTLKRCGMNIDTTCPRCGEEVYTITHMLLTCREAHILWRLSPLRLELHEWILGLKEWCESFAPSKSDTRDWELAMVFLWQVWNSRNMWVFKKKKGDARLLCDRTCRFIGELEAAVAREESQVGL